MSPFRSSAGPATVRMPTPSSSRTMNARLVLPSPGGPTRKHVVECLAARLRRLERDPQLLLRALLADEVGEAPWPERALDLVFLRRERRRQELGGRHAALRSARRTCSSTGSDSSTSASARSASTTE